MYRISLIAFMVTLMICQKVMGQDKTLVIMDGKLPERNQVYFCSGHGNTLDTDKIKKYWDDGRRITTAAYTYHGWFVVMSRDNGITGQTYNVKWDTDWISKNWKDNYRITSLSFGNNSALVVMSQNSGYTMQCYNSSSSWSELKDWIVKNWDKDYYITDAAYDGAKWYVVMSQTTKFTTQGYLRATIETIDSKIKSKVYDQGNRVQMIEYANGEYFVVHCKYAKNNNRSQVYNVQTYNAKDEISKEWEKDKQIAYIGGGWPESSHSVASSTPTNNNNYKPTNPTGGDFYYEGYAGNYFIRYWGHADGSCEIQQDIPCYSCTMNKGKCNICAGTGNCYYSIGSYMCCVACGGFGQCKTCGGDGIIQGTRQHWNKGQAEAFLKAHREVENAARRNAPTSSRSTCPVCGGARYKKERYSAAAASASGWMPPHHNYAGNKCTVCSVATEHYHYPCSECFGYGTVRH